MKNIKLEKVIIAIVFILVPFLLFKNGFQQGKIPYASDTISLDFPFRLFAQKMLWQYHDLPLWLPHLFGGIPLIDSTNLIYFYPTNLLYMLLPIPLYYTYTIDIILHMIIAAFGMYLLLRQFEMSKEGSLFGSFIFMIGGFFISLVNAGHWGNIKAIALIPYIFYFINKGIKHEKVIHFFNAAIFSALMILCIGMQLLFYTYIGVFMYIIYELFFAGNKVNPKRIRKIAVYFIISSIMVIIFGSLQFFQSAGYLNYSWRGDFTYDNFIQWSFNPKETISFIFPNFYGLKDNTYFGFEAPNSTTLFTGIIPFLLIPFAFLQKRNRRLAVFVAVCAIVFYIIGLGGFTPLCKLLFYIPVFNKFRTPLRSIYFFDIFVILLSSIAINNILSILKKSTDKNELNLFHKTWIWTSIITGFIFLIMLLFISNTERLSNFIGDTYFSVWKKIATPDFISLVMPPITKDLIFFVVIASLTLFIVYLTLHSKIKRPYIFISLIAILCFIDLYRVDTKFINYINFSDYYDKNNPIIQRLQQDKEPVRTQDVNAHFFYNKNIYYDLEFMSGDHGLLPLKYANMLKKQAFFSLTVNRLYNIKYYITDMYIKTPGFDEIISGPIQLIEDTKVFPRAFILDKVEKVENDDEIFYFLKSAQFNPTVALTTADIPIQTSPEQLNYNLNIKEYTPNKIIIDYETNKAGILVLSNNYYPSWKVKIDNNPGKIYNVDYAIMGVPVEKGKHEIKFYYSRTKILLSLLLTILGILIYIMVYFFEIRMKR